MENKKKAKQPVMDFDYVRAINQYVDDVFLNKTLQSLRGGSVPDKKDIITYKINNTNYLANLYPDPVMRGGKKTMLLDSIFKVPENFSLDNSMAELDLNGGSSLDARPKKRGTKEKAKPKKDGKKKTTKKKRGGGSELYEVDYSDVEDLGGNKVKDNDEVNEEVNEEIGGAKKKPGRKPKKNQLK
jgi:hypothetical protein